MIFHALMNGATIIQRNGTELWKNKSFACRRKVRNILAPEVDYTVHMMEWRFKKINDLIHRLMQDH